MRNLTTSLLAALLLAGCGRPSPSTQNAASAVRVAPDVSQGQVVPTSNAAQAGASCDGEGFYPPGKARMQVGVSATVADGKVTTHSLRVSADPQDYVVTPAGLQRGLRANAPPVDLNIVYDFPSPGAEPRPRRLMLSAFYPYQRTDLPRLQVAIGEASFSAPTHRDPKEGPKGSDVYAAIPLPSSAPGLYHPGQVAKVAMVDAAGGGELEHVVIPIPRPADVRAALAIALADLKEHCATAGDSGGPF